MIEERTVESRVEQELRHALQYLYDPTELRKNQLLALLGIAGKQSPLTQLRRTLSNAIERLKPESHVPLDAHAWRVYNILTYRFIERLSQREVAADLSLSVRQLRRDEQAAIRVLGHFLLHAYAVPDFVQQSDQQEKSEDSASRSPGRIRELEWLQQTFPSETVDVATLMHTVLATARPLTDASNVAVTCDLPDCVPSVGGQIAAIRQALLNILSALTPEVSGGRILIGAGHHKDKFEVRISAWYQDGHRFVFQPSMADSLSISQQLLELDGGGLRLCTPPDAHLLVMSLPAAPPERIPLLVIDDNADTLRLFQRYLSGAIFDLTCVSNPDSALATAVHLLPDAIILDVMLPGIDGWELLAQLRGHPDTYDIPVVVCTILPQERLALALGAAAFLQKPFTRESLFGVLAEFVTNPES